jgi:uncharacterized delta-60 repeat protein
VSQELSRSLVAAALVAALLAVSVAPAFAGGGPGHLDPSFGDRGISIVSKTRDATESVAIGKKGRIVLAGYGNVARLRANGRLDRSFGDGGVVHLQFPGYPLDPLQVAVSPKGGIFVAGAQCPTLDRCQFAVSHLWRDGDLDRGFGDDGTALVGFPGSDSEASAIAITRGGDLLVGGFSCGKTCGFALTRLYRRGIVDRSFGRHGKVTGSLGDCYPGLSGMGLDSHGRIVVSGSCDNGVASLARFKSNGKVDRSFGRRGKARKHAFFNEVAAIAIDHRDRIDVAGARNTTYGVVRFRRDGKLDSSFGKHGRAKAKFPADRHIGAYDVAVDSHGRIVVAGNASALGFARFKRDGRVDRRFGHNGVIALAHGKGFYYASTVAIDQRDRIVAGGHHRVPNSGGDEDLAAVRLLD